MRGRRYTFPADIWSLGCAIMFVCNGGEGPEDGWVEGLSESYYGGSYSDHLATLIKTMLDDDPKKRPTARSVQVTSQKNQTIGPSGHSDFYSDSADSNSNSANSNFANSNPEPEVEERPKEQLEEIRDARPVPVDFRAFSPRPVLGDFHPRPAPPRPVVGDFVLGNYGEILWKYCN